MEVAVLFPVHRGQVQWKFKKLKTKLIRQVLTLSQNCAAAAGLTSEPGQTGSERKERKKNIKYFATWKQRGVRKSMNGL